MKVIMSYKDGSKQIEKSSLWTYPCQVDSFKKTKQPSGVDILSVPDG
ncbi:hypothetical protein [Lysinibacillus sp. BW-2-10]|nr:hypothetical protein [Lysinibacillus sp. BW-2-10]